MEFSCPSCHAAKRLRGSRTFGSVTCAACGAAWRPRLEVGGYELHGQLARGGFSLIFHANDPASGESVAVKIFALPFGFTANDTERFTEEIQILAAYDHPHWLRIFGGGVEDDFGWLAMEWLPEGSLAHRGRLAENEALQMAAQIADALVAAHQCGLQHRNLQIGECLLADTHTVKVSGFAEAALYERAGVEVGTVWGRLSCAPPERVFEESEDSRSEIYALGAIVFQLLSGELPFDGATVPEEFLERLDEGQARVADFNPEIEPASVAIIDRMLAIKRLERFLSWEVTAEALEKRLNELNPTEASTHRRAAPKATARSRKARAGKCGARGVWIAVLVLTGSVGIAGWFGTQSFRKNSADAVLPQREITTVSTPTSAPDPALPPFDWKVWKTYLLESPNRPGTTRGRAHPIPGNGALRLSGSNSGLSGGHDENVFFARQMEGDWTFIARVRPNSGPAGIVARDGIGSDRPCVGIFITADGKLNAVLRAEPAAKLAPRPIATPPGSTWLRIARRGAAMSAFHSDDGKHWREAATLNAPGLPASVPIGFVVWSGVPEKEAEATFGDVRLDAFH